MGEVLTMQSFSAINTKLLAQKGFFPPVCPSIEDPLSDCLLDGAQLEPSMWRLFVGTYVFYRNHFPSPWPK